MCFHSSDIFLCEFWAIPVCFEWSISEIANINEVTDIYEVFPDSISQEENWADSVHNHVNEHALAWAISMHFVWGNQHHSVAK